MKKTTAALAAALAAAVMLTACAEDGNTYKDDSFQAEKKEISKLYEGYEELQGKDFGLFRMPEHIEPQSFEKAYKFKASVKYGSKDNLEQAKKICKAFFGDQYEENSFTVDTSVFEKIHYRDSKGNICDYYDGFTGMSFADRVNLQEANFEGIYRVSTDGEKVIDFGTEKSTVAEVADSARRFFNENISAYSDYHAEPQDIYLFSYGRRKIAEIIYRVEYEGIPFEEYPSPTGKSIDLGNGMASMSFYSFVQPNLDVFGKDEFSNFHSDPPYVIKSKEEVSKLYSLKDACEILKNGLAEYSLYSFDDVKLMYVNLFTSETPENMMKLTNEEQREYFKKSAETEREFTPTWAFIVNDNGSGFGRKLIKVNAITGEITIDVST